MEGRKDDQKSNENEGTTKKAMRKKEGRKEGKKYIFFIEISQYSIFYLKIKTIYFVNIHETHINLLIEHFLFEIFHSNYFAGSILSIYSSFFGIASLPKCWNLFLAAGFAVISKIPSSDMIEWTSSES